MEMDIRRSQPVPVAAPSTNKDTPQVPVVPLPPHTKKPHQPRRFVSFIRHHWLTVGFLLGFVVDNLTLNRVDQLFDNVLLASYVCLAMMSTLLLYAGAADKLPEAIGRVTRRFAPFIMQYAFGSLLSGMLIFYGRSGAWLSSWPYLAIILLAIYGNETIKDRSTRLQYNLAILFIGLFSYVVLIVPVVTGLMGPWIFVGSGLIALMLMYAFIRLLYRIIPRFMELQMKVMVVILGSVFLGFNLLYFTNSIPPIPLSLKDVGIFNSVVKFENGMYQVKYEAGSWLTFYRNSNAVVHPRAGESIFCFAQVFAPAKITTDIVHVWERKDATGSWVQHASIPYVISGKAGEGYRGYTYINSYQDGKWRCRVETERGQVLGQEVFTIDTKVAASNLVTELR